ncbi:hypothetical protein NG2371_05751 [Nocardia gamkensis]|nr:hypothetical protein [Nocardia gamkensis]
MNMMMSPMLMQIVDMARNMWNMMFPTMPM